MKKYYVLISLFLVASFLAFSPPFLAAQEGRGEARLKGVVVDAEGNPIEGAEVELVSLSHDLSMVERTDEKGIFSFIGLGKTVVKITASKEGYEPTVIPTLEVSAFTARNAEQKIVLKKTLDIENLEDDDPKALYKKGEALFDQEEYEKALAVFEEFVAKQPRLYEARIYLGRCYTELNKYDEAVEEFTFVLEKMTEETGDLKGNEVASSVYANLGELYMDQDDFEKAKGYFEKSIEIAPVDAALAYNVAEILFKSGEVDEAIKYYLKSTQIKPEWHKPYIKLGYCYINKGEMETAVEYLEKYTEIAPDDDPEKAAASILIEQLRGKN